MSLPLPVYVGTNVRDWLYVEDHARALELVLTRGAIGESYNGRRPRRTHESFRSSSYLVISSTQSGRHGGASYRGS